MSIRSPNAREAAAIQLAVFLAQPVILEQGEPGIVIEVSETETSQIYRLLWDDPETAKRVLAQLGNAIEQAWPGSLSGLRKTPAAGIH